MFSTPRPEGAGVAAGTGMRGARAVGRRGHLQEPGPQQKAVPTTETRQRQNWRNKSHNLTFLPHSIHCGWVFPRVTPVGGPRARWQHTEMCLQSTEWGGGECTGNWERQAGPGTARKRDLGRAQEKELLDASSRKTTLFSATSVKIRVLPYHATTSLLQHIKSLTLDPRVFNHCLVNVGVCKCKNDVWGKKKWTRCELFITAYSS